jgi:hypothetical protein
MILVSQLRLLLLYAVIQNGVIAPVQQMQISAKTMTQCCRRLYPVIYGFLSLTCFRVEVEKARHPISTKILHKTWLS